VNVAVRVRVGVRVCVPVQVAVPVRVAVLEGSTVGVPEGVEAEGVRVAERVGVRLGVGDAVAERLGVGGAVVEAVGDGDGLAVRVGVGLRVGTERVAVALAVTNGSPEDGVIVGERLGGIVGVAVGQNENALVSRMGTKRFPTGFVYSRTAPVSVSVTFTRTPTVVIPAAKNHCPCPMAQASSTLATSSTLPGSKNQRYPDSPVSTTACASPECPDAVCQLAATR